MKHVRLSLTIGWLYPEIMSTYGDRGNIICLRKRCEWRGIGVNIKNLDVGFSAQELKSCDFLFMGGAQDRQQKIVSADLTSDKVKYLKEMIEDEVPGLYICGAYQFLGKYYKEADGTVIDGLSILDLYTESPRENNERLIGNIVIESRIRYEESGVVAGAPFRCTSIDTLVGFENHGGRTYLGKGIKPLGKVLKGFGNNGEDKTEGAIYKNSFGSYLHGPILPKNSHFADLLIRLSLEKKYKRLYNSSPLDDSLEWKAHGEVAKRLGVAI